MTGALEAPMFNISLQRNTIDLGGEGLPSIGKLPDGVDNSSLAWVPVRLYTADEGGVPPPSFAPNEVYPFRWELDLDAVFLGGQQLPNSTIPANEVDSNRVSPIVDTGNSIIRGPEDVINNILSTVSPSYSPKAQNSVAPLPCNIPHTSAFQIGGKIFPIDLRDFIGQLNPGNAMTCQADILVPTDPPAVGSLFRWSLGTPFFRSNLVVFHYRNLTNPSVDPPRIGILSNVPANAGRLLQGTVQSALSNGGNFTSTLHPAHTARAAVEAQFIVSSGFYGSTKAATTTTAVTPASATSNANTKSASAATNFYTGDRSYSLVTIILLFGFLSRLSQYIIFM